MKVLGLGSTYRDMNNLMQLRYLPKIVKTASVFTRSSGSGY